MSASVENQQIDTIKQEPAEVLLLVGTNSEKFTNINLRAVVISMIVMVVIFGGFLISLNTTSLAKAPDTVTLCNGIRQDSSTKFETLTLSRSAVYANDGYFEENGTTRTGHEESYLGPCVSPTPSPIPTPVPNLAAAPVGGSSIFISNNNEQHQEQRQEQHQEQRQEQHQEQVQVQFKQANPTQVTNGTVAGARIGLKKAPETGAGLLGMGSMFGAAPIGVMLSRFGKGRIIIKKKEDLTETAMGIITGRRDKTQS